MYLGGRLESEVLVMIPKVAGAPDLVCTKNFGVTGSVQTASTNGAHVHSKVILNGSEIVTCYLLGEEEEAGGGGGAGKLASCCFLGEVRRTPSGDLKRSLPPLLNALSLQADSHAPATSPGRFRKSPCLSKSPLLAPLGRNRHTGSPWSFPVPSSHPRETPKCQKTLSSTTPQLLSLALVAPARQ